MKVKELKERLHDLLNILDDVDENLECVPHSMDEILSIEVRDKDYCKALAKQNLYLKKSYKLGLYKDMTEKGFRNLMKESDKHYFEDLTPTKTIEVFGFEPITTNLITEI